MKHVLVTGGGGFVGSTIVRMLLAKGCLVRVVGRHRYPEIETMGAHCLVGDIRDRSFMEAACQGMDTVFHTAAKAGIWGSRHDYYTTNVEGTRSVVAASLKNKVQRLVYTSTPSVVFRGRDIIDGDETLPYASRFLCHYPGSKAMAEQHVLASNSDDLQTCAIRPHLIWGPNDPHLVPRLIERGTNRSLKIVGSGTNRVDITYIDNVAQAHILAAESLEKSGKAAGQAYFIGQERPVYLWDWVNELFGAVSIPAVQNAVPLPIAYGAGAVLEAAHLMFAREQEPRMTRFLAQQLARSHFFSHEKAKRDFGYSPQVSLEEGHLRLMEWLQSRT